jgi:hypothetical protein
MDFATYFHQARSVLRSLPAIQRLTYSFTVTLGGAALFLLFGVIYAYEAFFWDELDSVVDALAPTLRLV